MAFDAFLKIDGIPGESTDDAHPDWIEILSYELCVSQKAARSKSSGGGGGSGRADFEDFKITKALDKASPKLFQKCADGTHIDNITIEICRSGGDKFKYMEYKLTNSIITSWKPSADAEGDESLPRETVTFNPGKLELIYTYQKRAGGGSGGNELAGWDLEKNVKV